MTEETCALEILSPVYNEGDSIETVNGPCLLAHRTVIESLLPEQGVMKQGIWWEFAARIHRRGFSICELSVWHRPRFAGTTQVYRLSKLPGIGYGRFLALLKIWSQTLPAI